jgi:anti-sigma B factor antagonist
MLTIKQRQVDSVTILDLEGNVIMGGASAMLRDTIRRLSEGGYNKILLNFNYVKYIDSSGIGELVSSLVSLNRIGGHLELFGLQQRASEVFSLSSLLSIFEIYDDEAEALKGFD